MPFLALMTGPIGRMALYAGIIVAAIGSAWFAIHEHDNAVLARQAAREAAAVAAEQVADARRAVNAANAEALAATARASILATAKTEIARAPITSGCVASPAIGLALDQLRAGTRTSSGAPGNPGGAAGMPTAAGAAKPAPR